MKRCKECKWIRPSKHNDYDGRIFHTCHMNYHNPTYWFNETGQCGQYVRKPWMGWLWLIALILILTLALLLGGCVHVKLPDGTEYWQLGEARKVNP